jgi:hypothetical protein
MIPFPFRAREEIQIANIFHFEFSKKFFFHLQKLVLIIAHQDEIIDVDDYEKFNIFDLLNTHAKVASLFTNSMFFKKSISFWFQAFGDYFRLYNDL